MGVRRGTGPPVHAVALQLDEDGVPVPGVRLRAKPAAEEEAPQDDVAMPKTRPGSSPRRRAVEPQPHHVVALHGGGAAPALVGGGLRCREAPPGGRRPEDEAVGGSLLLEPTNLPSGVPRRAAWADGDADPVVERVQVQVAAAAAPQPDDHAVREKQHPAARSQGRWEEMVELGRGGGRG